MRIKQYKFIFVSHTPDVLDDDVIYISIQFNVAIHKCACGCGEKVVTPIDPKCWTLIYDGDTVSFSPSIGNWSYRCRSHYFIKRNRVIWARQWSEEEVQNARGNAKPRRLGNFETNK